ncbi:MAG: hypothetical protein KGZ61_04115 [Sandarakinorhabdus sp.]|nr:hypothetical protein [Sandarakinorhabdus sp.]
MLKSRWHLGHALLLALAAACLVQAWQLLAAMRTALPLPPPFVAPPMADRALLARFDPFFPSRAASGEALPVTALPFSLHGVRADSSTGRGSAIIASGDGVQQVYAVGDLISDGVSLAAIARDHVVLERSGVREALWLDSAGGNAVQRFDIAAAEPPETGAGTDGAGTADPAALQPGSPAMDGAAMMPAVPADPQ